MSAGKSDVLCHRLHTGNGKWSWVDGPANAQAQQDSETFGWRIENAVPESLLLDARAERDLAIEAVCQADAFSCELAEKLRRAEALADSAIGQAFREWYPASDYFDTDCVMNKILTRAREIEQSRGALPELPEPSFKLKWVGDAYKVNQPSIGNTECYTAAQMKAYGEACRRMGNRDE